MAETVEASGFGDGDRNQISEGLPEGGVSQSSDVQSAISEGQGFTLLKGQRAMGGKPEGRCLLDFRKDQFSRSIH